MTMTDSEAYEAILAHHRSLTEGVARRVAALGAAVASHGPFEAISAELVTYLAREVLPHALAEEQTIYRAAAEEADLRSTVQEMTAEHGRLADLSEKLAQSAEGPEAAVAASTIGPLFTAHVNRENEVLLPRLLAGNGADLAALLGQMHDLLQEAGDQTAAASTGTVDDPLPSVLALLLDAAKALAGSGKRDQACRLVATAWAALRGPRPDLAVRATAALHGLVRTAEPVRFGRGLGAPPKAAEIELDVRHLAPAQRHEVIFSTYAELSPGTSFVLVNDHDPKPLYYQFAAEHEGEFSWESLEEGPQAWRVRVGRAAARAVR